MSWSQPWWTNTALIFISQIEIKTPSLSRHFFSFQECPADLPTPKRQDSKPRAGKISEKWVKSCEMSQSPCVRNFCGDYGYWKSLSHFKAGAVNITINFTIEVLHLLCFVGTILKQEKQEVCTFIWRIMKIPVGVICWGHTLLNLHNSSDDTEAQFNNCYILYATLQ